MYPHQLVFVIITSICTIEALIGYDCGARSLNVTTLSLLDVGECDLPKDDVEIQRKYIQLLQVNEFLETNVIQCKLEVHRTIYACGMFSHVSIVRGGEIEYISDVSHDLCKQAHTTGILKFGNSHILQGLKVNHTSSHSLTFAGSLDSEGKCTGAGYSDPYGTWESVVVQGTLKVTLTQFTARVSLNSNHVHLRSGTACTLAEGSCLDTEGGYTFWRPLPVDNCHFNDYSILYEGYANKMKDLQIDLVQTVYSLSSNDVTFALTAKATDSVCGYVITRTEHPKLVIFETVKGESFATNGKISVSDLDIFAYVNSKFVYVEKHLRTQIKQLYYDVVQQRCSLEKQTIKNSLAIATQSPDEFAFHLMKGPGYMAVVAGEVVHVVKCIPVEVRVEHRNECFAELPVTRNNVTYYLSPRTHILKSHGTKIACNALLPPYYFFGEGWYKILPRITEALPPNVIKPMTRPTWKYINPTDLATTGIYTEKDLRDLRERIMFPVERTALLNDVARELHGQPIPTSEGVAFKLLNEDTLTRLAHSTWDRMWSKFMTFGTASAGLIAIIVIFQIIKTVLDIFIRGYTLHSVFGWSFYIFGAIWSTVAHLLIHQHNPKKETENDVEAGTPLNSYNGPQIGQGNISVHETTQKEVYAARPFHEMSNENQITPSHKNNTKSVQQLDPSNDNQNSNIYKHNQ